MPIFLFTGKQFGKAEAAMNQWIEVFGEGKIDCIEKNRWQCTTSIIYDAWTTISSDG